MIFNTVAEGTTVRVLTSVKKRGYKLNASSQLCSAKYSTSCYMSHACTTLDDETYALLIASFRCPILCCTFMKQRHHICFVFSNILNRRTRDNAHICNEKHRLVEFDGVVSVGPFRAPIKMFVSPDTSALLSTLFLKL